MDTEDQNKKLIPFLRNLADSIEKKELLPQQLQSVGEFFMTYQFQQQAINDNDNSTSELHGVTEFDNKDILKFLVLGWYCYCVILRDDRFPNLVDDNDFISYDQE
jgi:hypothetical protein